MPFVSGRSVQGIAAGDCEPSTFLPQLVDRVRKGDLPIERLQRRYAFEDINRAVDDAASGATIKPILMF
jgi:aryl-alcohol dehydrogenase